MFLKYFCVLVILGCIWKINATYQNYYWRDYIPGYIPNDAIEGAPGRYIGQVTYNGNLPATIYPSKNEAINEMWGQRVYSVNIKILCTPEPNKFYWEYVNFNSTDDQQMKNAVRGGYQEDITTNLYIGKIYNEGEWKIAKVVPIDQSWKGFFIWDKNRGGIRLLECYMLKYNTTST